MSKWIRWYSQKYSNFHVVIPPGSTVQAGSQDQFKDLNIIKHRYKFNVVFNFQAV